MLPVTHRCRQSPALVALALVVALLPGLTAGAARADDPTCVGRAEYRQIHGGMTFQKLTQLLDGQTPLADREINSRLRVRWYAACDGWQPVKDVAVRYHKPVVGRRTVAGKKLGIYQEEPTPTDGPTDGPTNGPTDGPKPGPRHPHK
jgi:hypothetical protein